MLILNNICLYHFTLIDCQTLPQYHYFLIYNFYMDWNFHQKLFQKKIVQCQILPLHNFVLVMEAISYGTGDWTQALTCVWHVLLSLCYIPGPIRHISLLTLKSILREFKNRKQMSSIHPDICHLLLFFSCSCYSCAFWFRLSVLWFSFFFFFFKSRSADWIFEVSLYLRMCLFYLYDRGFYTPFSSKIKDDNVWNSVFPHSSF